MLSLCPELSQALYIHYLNEYSLDSYYYPYSPKVEIGD